VEFRQDVLIALEFSVVAINVVVIYVVAINVSVVGTRTNQIYVQNIH